MRVTPACSSLCHLARRHALDHADTHTSALACRRSTDAGDAAATPGETKTGKRSKRGAEAGEDESSDDDDVPFAFVRQNLAFYKSNKDDPHLKIDEEDEDGSEVEDFSIQPSDLMLLGARSDEEMSNLEVYVYETKQDNMYVHHDIPLPVFPLCLAWMETPPAALKGPLGGGRNFVAVGTFQPFIEIWNLDVIDALEPAAVLGGAGAEAALAAHDAVAADHEAAGGGADGADGGGKKKKKNKKARPAGDAPLFAEGHTDAVMCLAWNKLQPNVLASGSADTTVRLWDLQGDLNSSAQTLRHHSDKVQALAWHPVDASVLLSAGFDRRVYALDVRSPQETRGWQLTADVEAVQWNPHNAHYFVASTEDGLVKCFDARVDKKSVWSLRAHDGAASGLDFCPDCADVLATGGMDKKVKLWSTAGGKPSMLAEREMGLGVIFDLKWSADAQCPGLLAAGGSLGKLGVWNTLETEAMQQRMPHAEAPLDDDGHVMGSAVAGMGELEVNSSGDEEDDEEGAMMQAAKGKGKGKGKAAADDRATAREPEEEEDDEDDDDDEDAMEPAEERQPRAKPKVKAGGKGKVKGKGKGKKAR